MDGEHNKKQLRLKKSSCILSTYDRIGVEFVEFLLAYQYSIGAVLYSGRSEILGADRKQNTT